MEGHNLVSRWFLGILICIIFICVCFLVEEGVRTTPKRAKLNILLFFNLGHPFYVCFLVNRRVGHCRIESKRFPWILLIIMKN